MSIVFSNESRGPKTHVLLIGVGSYPYLNAALSAKLKREVKIADLTSAPKSANALANWFMTSYCNPKAPLGSVDIVASPEVINLPAKRGVRVSGGTVQNIVTAFDGWYERCNSDRENVAVFYFCGHGMQNADALLLPEDIGAERNRMWDNAINIKQTHYGMGECQAKTQCYFIDACREIDIERAADYGLTGRRLKSTDKTVFERRDAPILYATPLGEKAFGRINGISYLSEALIRALNGAGVSYYDGVDWKVESGSLNNCVGRLMNRMVVKGQRLACAIGGESHFPSILHIVKTTPEVLGEVTCDPVAALTIANLSIQNGGVAVRQRGPVQEPWEFEVPAGTYDVAAKFTAAGFSDAVMAGQQAAPPVFTRQLKV